MEARTAALGLTVGLLVHRLRQEHTPHYAILVAGDAPPNQPSERHGGRQGRFVDLARARTRLLIFSEIQRWQPQGFHAVHVERPTEVAVVELAFLLPAVVVRLHRGRGQITPMWQRQVLPGPGLHDLAALQGTLGDITQRIHVTLLGQPRQGPHFALAHKLLQRRIGSLLVRSAQPFDPWPPNSWPTSIPGTDRSTSPSPSLLPSTPWPSDIHLHRSVRPGASPASLRRWARRRCSELARRWPNSCWWASIPGCSPACSTWVLASAWVPGTSSVAPRPCGCRLTSGCGSPVPCWPVAWSGRCHHDYFNLADTGNALEHRLTLPTSHFTTIDDHLIPMAIQAVDGTPFYFREPVRIDECIRANDAQPALARGYDHNGVLDRTGRACTSQRGCRMTLPAACSRS